RWINRGGGCVMHAPGQLAVYPVLPLDRLGIGLAEYRRLLEECAIAACREIRVPAWRFDDEPGVWCRLGQFAYIGVAVKSWVAYHGLFINVSPAMDLIRLVQAGGSGERATSLSAQRERPTPMHAVREGLIRHLVQRLGYQRFHVYTGHPLLRRTERTLSIATA
ncbi:MAG: lipoyl protein ligase domain-containing protein, partial [Candidatus Binatia bacterium]